MAGAKFNLRLTEDLREQAHSQAERNGLSLNALCVTALHSHVEWQTGRRRSALTPSSFTDHG